MARRPYRINPRVARERAAAGGRASQTVDAYITRIVNRAPELTPEQRRAVQMTFAHAVSVLTGGPGFP